MGTIVVCSLKAESFIIGTPTSGLISIRIYLVGQFRYHFRYQIGGSLIIVVLVVRVVVSHRGMFSQDYWVGVVILDPSDLLDKARYLGML